MVKFLFQKEGKIFPHWDAIFLLFFAKLETIYPKSLSVLETRHSQNRKQLKVNVPHGAKISQNYNG